MKAISELLKELRDGRKIGAIADHIKKTSTRPTYIMEVCGGHTHVIMRFGLTQILPEGITFLHGPGCPVCIMPKERIDQAIALSQQEHVILVTLGDMMRIPGSSSSLTRERAEGRDVRMVYSPFDVIKIGRDNPGKKVVFFAIGFETTSPLTAALVHQVLNDGIGNVYFHINHVLVPPALHAVMDAEDVLISAFIAPGHVSTITGTGIYNEISGRFGVPVVVSGFEPVDILQSVLMIMAQVSEGRHDVEIQYTRAVTPEGNRKARDLVSRYFQTRESFRWRGLGDIPRSGLELKEDFSHLDAEKVFHEILPLGAIDDHRLCICSEILRGKAKPTQCSVFGRACTPGRPVGACMVSPEGACHAYYSYQHV